MTDRTTTVRFLKPDGEVIAEWPSVEMPEDGDDQMIALSFVAFALSCASRAITDNDSLTDDQRFLAQMVADIPDFLAVAGTATASVKDVNFRHVNAETGEVVDWQDGSRVIQPRQPRRSTKPVNLPWDDDGSVWPMANLQAHGTRRLGQAVSGAAAWVNDENEGALIATVAGTHVGRLRFDRTIGELEARQIVEALAPRTLKTMVAISRLYLERTRGRPERIIITVTLRELAEACGYKPDKNRAIDPEILRRVYEDLKALSRIETRAAAGEWDKSGRRFPTDWVSALIYRLDERFDRADHGPDALPYEFDLALGRPWAAALTERFDVLAVADGFMQLDPADHREAIRLAWFYLTAFRYRTPKGKQVAPISIRQLCEEAVLAMPDGKHLGRFLERLEAWHVLLKERGIIGAYRRDPALGTNARPSEMFASGTYQVSAPDALIEAYADMHARHEERRILSITAARKKRKNA